MASVINDPNGRKRIQFVAPDGKRKTIRLGQVDRKTAESICRQVEHLLAAQLSGQPIPRETAAWLGSIGEKLRQRLSQAGLIEARPKVPTLGELIDSYLSKRTDIKRGTRINLEQARRYLLDYFGADCRIDAITEAQAEDYFRHLLQSLASNTARRLAGQAKQFLAYAVRARLLERNPFVGVKTTITSNPDRQAYVSVETIQRVIDACPDAEWRLIVALSRFAGLRCPSEHLALTWGDVLWDRGRMIVRSPKTEHHEGKGQRIVPIFPELRPYLEEAFELAEPGSVWVINRNRSRTATMLTGVAVNWRTKFRGIVRRAGVQPWPRLFHALRASCQTDLANRFPAHVVCAWLGNSWAVAHRHYLRVTEEHFEQAIRGAKSDAPVTQKAAQHGRAQECTAMKTPEQIIASGEDMHSHALLSTTCSPGQLVSQQPETVNFPPEKCVFPDQGGAESDAIDPDLARLMRLWPELPPPARGQLMRLAQQLARSLRTIQTHRT